MNKKIRVYVIVILVHVTLVFSSAASGRITGPLTICSPTDGFCYQTCRAQDNCYIGGLNATYCAVYVGEGELEVYNRARQACRYSKTGDQCFSCASKTPIGDTATIYTEDGI